MDIFSYEAKIKTFLLLFLLSAVDERGKSMARGQMNSAQIERCLGFLGQKLADMQINAKIILLGGAVMVTQLGNRNATQDIDAVIATNDRQVYQAIQQAIAAVAREKKLAQAWLNDDVTIVVDQVGKPKAPRYWKTYGSLDVYIPELEYILALKLFSGRPQDYQDIQALAQHCSLQTQEQAWSLVHRYIPKAHNLVSGSSTQQMPSTVAFSASIYSVTD
jgi:hypothetical protein